ncbi:hypothetical protein Q31a_05990 [Aureliella helgolandensis]|uniref:Uncharacterized protein n=1 Tax=Aureliella helgolandensis TaxID=2527968 RepID=A0A518G134_9BACT|nr:hypothetical protein Q31a_05990 [Aureliella helgolandensis]
MAVCPAPHVPSTVLRGGHETHMPRGWKRRTLTRLPNRMASESSLQWRTPYLAFAGIGFFSERRHKAKEC